MKNTINIKNTKKLLSELKKDDKKMIFFRLIICLIVLVVGIAFFLIIGSLKPKPREKSSDYLIKTLITMPVRKEDIREVVVGYGTAEPKQVIAVSSPIDGEVVYVMPNLKNGVLVEKDTVLARIDKTDYEIALKRAVAEININKSKMAVQTQEIKDNKKILEILDDKLRLEKADFNRQKQLFEKKAVSAQFFENAEQSLISMTQIHLKMKSDIAKAELGLDSIAANIDKAEAERRQAEININRCEIKSPISGRLENVSIEKNEYIVRLKEKPLFDVADDSNLFISVPLDTRAAAAILTIVPGKTDDYEHWFKYDKATPVVIRWTEEPEKCVWKGQIARIEKFDPETRTITVVVKAVKFIGKKIKRLPLVDGMYCEVEFTGKELKDAVKIPWSALQLNGHVYVVDDKNIVHEKKVDIKSSRQDQIIITSGLDDGEKIITQRIPYGVVNGSKVKTISVKKN
jgi:membrane fusion protein, multidrug efflux system